MSMHGAFGEDDSKYRVWTNNPEQFKESDQDRQEKVERRQKMASQLRISTQAGKLGDCPACRKPSLMWDKNNDRWECLACSRVYNSEYDLLAALTNYGW